MDPAAAPLVITLDNESDDVTACANPSTPPNTSLIIPIFNPNPAVRRRNKRIHPDVPNTSLVNPSFNPNPVARGGTFIPSDVPNTSLDSPCVNPNPNVLGPAERTACRPGYNPRAAMHRLHNRAAQSSRGHSNNRVRTSPSFRCQSSPEQPIPYVRQHTVKSESDVPPADDPDDLPGVDVEIVSIVPAPPEDAVALPRQPRSGPIQEPAGRNNAIQQPKEKRVASASVSDTLVLPSEDDAPAATIQQPPNIPAQQLPNLPAQQPPKLPAQPPPNHPAQQPPNLPAQQPPKLPAQPQPNHPAQQPPNLPAQQPPNLPAQQPPKLPAQPPPNHPAQQPPKLPAQPPPNHPAQQPPNLPAQQPPKLPAQPPPNHPAQQPPNLPAQQPPKLPAQPPPNHPAQQPPNLSAQHKLLQPLTEWFPNVDVDDLRDLCDTFGPDVPFDVLVTSLMQSQELPHHDNEEFIHGVEDDVRRFPNEVALTADVRPQHKHSMYLSEMFPDMNVEDVQKRCAEFDPEESLEVMMEAFLASAVPDAVQSDVSSEEFFDAGGNDASAVAHDDPPSVLEERLDYLVELFPDIDLVEVQERCEEFGPDAPINNIVASLIESHGGTEDDGAVAAAPAAAEVTEADLERLNAYQSVMNILPDADPDYLQEQFETIGHDAGAWKRFVADALETKNYPTYEAYEERQKTAKVQRKYREQFSVGDFVETYADPVKHFREKVTSQDKSYMPHQKAYLLSRYPNTAEEEIDRIHAVMMFNLYNTCTVLSKQEGPVKKPHECSEYKECYAQVTSQELLEEIAFIENEVQILQYIANIQEQQRKALEKARRNHELMTCNCCYDDSLLLSAMTSCEDGHLFCKECVRRSAQVLIGMGKTTFPCLSDCGKNISWKALKEVLKPAVFNRVRQRQQLEEVQAANIQELEVCPFCDFGAIPLEGEIVFTCLNPDCMTISCRLCKEPNHIPLHCDELPEKDEQVKLRTYIEGRMTDALLRECWKCHKKFIKVDGCNKMTCTCGAIMCYLCRQPVKDYTHFNGQGGDKHSLCPLWSKNEEIHDKAVQKEALKAKEEVEAKNPNVVLKYDPTMVLP